jgi:hypothetical protein
MPEKDSKQYVGKFSNIIEKINQKENAYNPLKCSG